MAVTATCDTCDGYGTIASCGGEGCCEPDPCPECNATWLAERSELYTARREMAEMQQELREWRSGKRRVFWCTRATTLSGEKFYDPHTTRKRAFACRNTSIAHGWEARVYRVTVGPAKKKEAG